MYSMHNELMEHQYCRFIVRLAIENLLVLRFLSRSLRWESAAESQMRAILKTGNDKRITTFQ